MSRSALIFVVMVSVFGYMSGLGAEDWPTYMSDNYRSGVASTHVDIPLSLHWVHIPQQPPLPAWPEPAKQDYWNQVRELSPVVIYDRAYHVAAVDDKVFYASSADDQVYALDVETGEVVWRFFTEGPVRLAPVVVDGRVYFSSDDGYAYCVQADTGALLWKYAPAAYDRRMPGNGRIISYAPARTGVLVDSGVAYFFSGLFSPDQVYKAALDAVTGAVLHSDLSPEVSPQGYLLSSSARLFVPTGRTSPAMYDRAGLEHLGAMQGPGGAYAILVEDAVVSGPGVRAVNQLHYADQHTRESVATFSGVRMLVHEGMAYLQSPDEVAALDRRRFIELSVGIKQRNEQMNLKNRALRDLDLSDAEQAQRLGEEIAELLLEIGEMEEARDACYLWKYPADDPYAMILVGDILFMGGQDRLYALSASEGTELWQYSVEGRVYGLAAARGRLYASSSTGAIYCFGSAHTDEPHRIAPAQVEAPYGHDETTALYGAAAEFILERSGIDRGYCLVLGAGEGRLAYELARRSDLHVIGVERDAGRVAAAREALADTGLYGTRIAMHEARTEALPYTSYMANLVVSEEALVGAPSSWEASEIFRVLRPYGGQAFVGLPEQAPQAAHAPWQEMVKDTGVVRMEQDWLVIERGEVPGAGEWTQLYGDASHTAFSDEQLKGPVTVQWFGDPGPREMVDRHHRPMSSMFQNGRLFVTGDNKVITVDGYNGFPLWELEVPDSRRIGVMKSSGHQLLADGHLFIVRADECWAVDVATGKHEYTIKAPGSDEGDQAWGYLNSADGLLIGSVQALDANFKRMSKAMVSVLEGDYRPVIMSESLFAVDQRTGAPKWRYHGGRILNAMITIGGGRLYLVESRNASVMDTTDGRVRINEFLADDAWLVALDVRTGVPVWERSVTLPFEHIAYLSGREGVLLASGSYNNEGRLYYDLIAFNMEDGLDQWHTTLPGMNIRGTDYSGLEGSHGEQWQHPVITKDTIFLRPYAFSLETGEQKEYIAYRGGHGCGGLTGSAHYLFGRGAVPRMYPMDESGTEGIPLTEVSRPGCFLNIIPAGGIIMVPESSSGCTCGYPLQTSIALAPASLAGGVKRDI